MADTTIEYDIQYAQISDTTLAYVEAGEGDPVLFVHGSLGDFRNWRAQMEAMRGRYRCIAMSRRLNWPNPYDDGGKQYSAVHQAKDIAEFIQTLGIEGCHIAAASYGAFSTLHACIRTPGLAGSLTIGEPPIIPWLHHLPGGQRHFDYLMESAWNPAVEAFKSGNLESGVRNFLKGVTGRDTYGAAPKEARQRLMDNAEQMRAEVLSPDVFPVFTCEQISAIHCPVLLLTGEFSPPFFSIITDELQRCLPNIRRDVIPKTSHSLQTGNPEYYTQILMNFLEEIAGK